MKNWWSDSELAETCGEFHCKYFTLHGCTNPYVKYCENGSLFWPFDIIEDMERFRSMKFDMQTIKMFNAAYSRACYHHKKRVRKKNYARARYMMRRGNQISRKEWKKYMYDNIHR